MAAHAREEEEGGTSAGLDGEAPGAATMTRGGGSSAAASPELEPVSYNYCQVCVCVWWKGVELYFVWHPVPACTFFACCARTGSRAGRQLGCLRLRAAPVAVCHPAAPFTHQHHL
jgi:hypothetical protein